MIGSGRAGEDASSRDSVRLAETFVSLADTLVDDYDVVDLMDRLVTTCVDLLDMTAAGLLLTDQRGGLQLVASSSEEIRLLELFQLQNEEGPCLDCVATARPVAVADLADGRSRWPRFAQEALRSGYGSVYAVPLRLRQDVIGGLNLFRAPGPPLTAYGQRIAQALADVATIAVLQQRSAHRAAVLAEQLQTALDSRVVIEQAKGVLAQRGGVSMDTAYRALRRYARDHNLRLSALADHVVTGELDGSLVVAAGTGAAPPTG
jgi:transcriptional regulator with GAF, ATPase, and Fis domain